MSGEGALLIVGLLDFAFGRGAVWWAPRDTEVQAAPALPQKVAPRLGALLWGLGHQGTPGGHWHRHQAAEVHRIALSPRVLSYKCDCFLFTKSHGAFFWLQVMDGPGENDPDLKRAGHPRFCEEVKRDLPPYTQLFTRVFQNKTFHVYKLARDK